MNIFYLSKLANLISEKNLGDSKIMKIPQCAKEKGPLAVVWKEGRLAISNPYIHLFMCEKAG